MIVPNFNEEKRLRKCGFRVLAGVDEVGRGALAGPVVVAACAVTNFRAFCRHPLTAQLLKSLNLETLKSSNLATLQSFNLAMLQSPNPETLASSSPRYRDSKSLTPAARDALYALIARHPLLVSSVGRVGPAPIDRLNIRRATLLAMRRAVLRLPLRPDALLIDGIEHPFGNARPASGRTPPPIQYTYIKGDSRVFLIAAASIVAKVTRDRLMVRLAAQYPRWAFAQHKGYATRLHKRLIRRHGLSPIHRKTFTANSYIRTRFAIR
jgi:ribonuclease HII